MINSLPFTPNPNLNNLSFKSPFNHHQQWLCYNPLHLPILRRRRRRQEEVASSLRLQCSSLDHQSSSSYTSNSNYIPSVASSPSPPLFYHSPFTQRHLFFLNLIACATAVSATWLFVSAIPTLLAMKRAANSLEKLMDATREELPDTMAAIRLSGMEISDLTMELSNLGEEITQGVRSSTRAVRSAEERLRTLTNINTQSPASLQRVSSSRRTETGGPVVAMTARGIKDVIVRGRAIWQTFFALTQFSRIAFNYFRRKRGKK